MTTITAEGDAGSVEFDGHTVTITRYNASCQATTWCATIDQISGVAFKEAGGFTRGQIAFAVPGASGGYALMFQRLEQARIADVRDAVLAAIDAARAPAAATPDGKDPADLVRKLAELRDTGILTDEEFEAGKARALIRL